MHQVFLSYNSVDRDQIKIAAEGLASRGLKVWWDRKSLDKRYDWVPQLEDAMKTSQSYAVFWGPEGYGDFQETELSFIKVKFSKRHPCAVVCLPGASLLPPDDFLLGANRVRLAHRGDEGGLDELYKTLTGDDPRPLEQRQQTALPLASEVEQALMAQSDELKRRRISFFVGPSTDPASLVRMDAIRSALLCEMQLPGPAPRIETAGTYYSVRKSDVLLEQEVRELCEKHTLDDCSAATKLVNLLHVIQKGSSLRKAPQLVVTTRYDVMIERELLKRGLSFHRIVHHRFPNRASCENFEVERVEDGGKGTRFKVGADALGAVEEIAEEDEKGIIDLLARSGQSVQPVRADAVANNDLENLSLEDSAEIVLYKYAGSIDVPRSCLLSTEQQLDFARLVVKHGFVPRVIRSMFLNEPVLALGYSLLDWDLRLVRHTLFSEEPRRPEDTWLVRPQAGCKPRDVFCQMEDHLWDGLVKSSQSLGFELLQIEEEEYLDLLAERVEGAGTGSVG